MTDSDHPFVEVVIRYEMPLPPGTSRSEAFEAARAEFPAVREADDATFEMRYISPDGQEESV